MPHKFLWYNASKYRRNSYLRANIQYTSLYCLSETGPSTAIQNVLNVGIHYYRAYTKSSSSYAGLGTPGLIAFSGDIMGLDNFPPKYDQQDIQRYEI